MTSMLHSSGIHQMWGHTDVKAGPQENVEEKGLL